MIYLFLGEDREAKIKSLADIKAQHFSSNDARTLDYESFHAPKLDPAELKKALIALPAVAAQRVIMIRDCEKLSTSNKNIILEFAQGDHAHAVLILDTDQPTGKSSFFNTISSLGKIRRFGERAAPKNVFDMTKAIERRNVTEALSVLDELIQAGNHPLQIMGGLVWFWGKLKNRLSGERFKTGLLILQEADLNIKRSRLAPEYAMEVAVTKLADLLNSKHAPTFLK